MGVHVAKGIEEKGKERRPNKIYCVKLFCNKSKGKQNKKVCHVVFFSLLSMSYSLHLVNGLRPYFIGAFLLLHFRRVFESREVATLPPMIWIKSTFLRLEFIRG